MDIIMQEIFLINILVFLFLMVGKQILKVKTLLTSTFLFSKNNVVIFYISIVFNIIVILPFYYLESFPLQ